MIVFEIILIVLAVITLCMVSVVAIECVAAIVMRSSGRLASSTTGSRAAVAILVPAHNEEASIAETVVHLRGHLHDGDRVLVVADNCSDHTAARARDAGAEVFERQNEANRGKGFALAAGVDALRSEAPGVVIVVDADCRLDDGTIDALAQQVRRTGRPAQAAYVMTLPEQPSPRDAVSGFAFLFKNVVRPSGMAALGQPCLLTGTGMAFPWPVIENARLATGDIVEDMRIGIEMAIAGHPPIFCRSARVWSSLPGQRSAATSQRTRWEHGHLSTILRFVPRLTVHGLLQMRLGLLALAAELAVPPLSLLVAWMVVLAIGTGALATFGTSWIPLLFAGMAWVILGGAVFLGWWGFARGTISLGQLLSAPLYVLWKLPMYARFLVKPQRKWVRTERDGDTQAPHANEGTHS